MHEREDRRIGTVEWEWKRKRREIADGRMGVGMRCITPNVISLSHPRHHPSESIRNASAKRFRETWHIMCIARCIKVHEFYPYYMRIGTSINHVNYIFDGGIKLLCRKAHEFVSAKLSCNLNLQNNQSHILSFVRKFYRENLIPFTIFLHYVSR